VTDGLARDREVILFDNAGVSSSSGAFTQINQIGELIGHSGISYFGNQWSKSPKVTTFINLQALIGVYASTVSSDALGSSVHQQEITYEATEEKDHE
jgi:hypothetical protein